MSGRVVTAEGDATGVAAEHVEIRLETRGMTAVGAGPALATVEPARVKVSRLSRQGEIRELRPPALQPGEDEPQAVNREAGHPGEVHPREEPDDHLGQHIGSFHSSCSFSMTALANHVRGFLSIKNDKLGGTETGEVIGYRRAFKPVFLPGSCHFCGSPGGDNNRGLPRPR